MMRLIWYDFILFIYFFTSVNDSPKHQKLPTHLKTRCLEDERFGRTLKLGYVIYYADYI